MEKRLVKESLMYTSSHKPFTIRFWTGEVAGVSLVSYPSNALQTLARTAKGYTGYYEDQDVSQGSLMQFLEDMKNTKLATPVEMLNFVFLVRNVPRSWTHQAVRTRIGTAYVQESTRFIGSRAVYDVLAPDSVLVPPQKNTIRQDYYYGTCAAIGSYASSVEIAGVLSQDARQLLPHGLLTHMYWSINLKALMNVYNQRWCCQAEPSTWLPVMKQMKILISSSCGPAIAGFLTAPVDRGEDCGFHASFDRPCTWIKKQKP